MTVTPDFPVAEELESLQKEYTNLVKNIKSVLRKLIDNGTLELIDISDYLGEYYRIEGLTDATDIPRLFQQLWPYYSYLDVEVLEVIVNNEDFLINERIKKDMCTYKQHLKEFKQSTTLEKFKNAVTEALIPNPEVTSITCEVVIKLNREWGKKTLENFKTLVNYMFHQRMTHIRVEEGSIYITLLVPRSRLDFILEIGSLRKEFASLIGIFELTIDDQTILKEKEEIQFSFDQTLQNASRLGNDEAVQFLLDFIDNINYQNEEGSTALILASKGGHEQVVQTLVSAGANPNIQDNTGYTALMIACDTNSYSIVNYLLQTRANPDIQNNNGDTAIIIACRNNHSDIVKLLLQFNADPLITTRNDDTALTVSVYLNSIEIVEMLLDKQPENQKLSLVVTSLTTACQYGHSRLIISLLMYLLDYFTQDESQLFVLSAEGDHISTTSHIFDSIVDINCTVVNDITPLMIASSCGHAETVEVLLQAGANVNSTDNDGYSPLVYAITGHKSLQVIKQLLKAGAQLNVFINDQSIVDKVREEGREDICKLLEQCNVLNITEKEEEQQLQLSSRLTIPIIEAARIGNIEDVKLLLKEYADINIQKEDEWTALMLASQNGHTQVVELLLKENADVNAQKEDGWTALMIASNDGHTEVVELLLKDNADVNTQNEEGWTALMIASQNGHTQVVELLLKKNADVNIQKEDEWTALMLASQNGHTQVVELLLKENADVNAQNEEGQTALMIASNDGYTEVVELLLKDNADVNTQNEEGWTALMIASQNGHTQVVELLLKENADVNIQEKNGWTALMMASQNGHTQVVELLLKGNANVNDQNEEGLTALMKAIGNEHLEVVECLLQSKADPHIVMCFEGIEITAFVTAAIIGNRDIVEVLIDKSELAPFEIEKTVVLLCYGGDPTLITFLSNKLPHLTNDQRELLDSCVNGDLGAVIMKTLDSPDTPLVLGLTPLMIASSYGHDDIVDALIQAGADVNKQESYYGFTPLFFAVQGGRSTSIVEMLLKNGANLNVISMNRTPLDEANDNKDEAIIELLIKYGGQIASHLEDTKQSSEQTIKSSSQTSSETMTTPTSSLITSELRKEANKKQTKGQRLPNFKSVFNLFISHISNPTSTFKDINVKQDNKKKRKQDNKEEGQEDYLISITS